MSAHTPGPWNVERPFGEAGLYVAARTSALVCKLYPVDPGTFNVDQRVTEEANAAVIAASPDMLAALRLAHPLLVRLGDFIANGEGRCEAVLAVALALEKAKERAP